MIIKKILITFVLAMFVAQAFCQKSEQSYSRSDKDSVRKFKFRISSPWHTFSKFKSDKPSVQMYELHFKYDVDSKNIIGLKFATWRLFQPMGILWWDGLLDKLDSQTEFYPGFVRHTGFGVTYQRMLWRGLFATVEILPQLKTYLDEDNNKVGNGFSLYTSYHIGYHIPFLKGRMFVEPQIHCQYWPINTNTPPSYKKIDDKWRNYFLFEPNLYIGVKF
jgi:hypothetical protein